MVQERSSISKSLTLVLVLRELPGYAMVVPHLTRTRLLMHTNTYSKLLKSRLTKKFGKSLVLIHVP
jgi:hypothetical protein